MGAAPNMTNVQGEHKENGYANGITNGVNGIHQSRANGSLDITVLGMNSGTAMDGIDCALVRYRQSSPKAALHMKILQYDEMPVPQWIKKPILRMLRETNTTPSL
ncbi:hypothetical protein KCU77_g18907, partial [Aureobasidium melanogenum]